MEELATTQFWTGLMAIIVIDIVLSGDNAVVIALAVRSLPPEQQRRAIMFGSAAAVIMRVLLAVIAVELLRWPYLKIVGGALLFWIAIQLLLPEKESDGAGKAGMSLGAAIRTILIADVVMSLDNVLAVAAAAKDSVLLLVIGLAISIPLVIFGSKLMLKLMERYPVIITLGAALLGWISGGMITSDPAVKDWIAQNAPWLGLAAEIAGACAVVLVGRTLAAREMARRAALHAPAAALAPMAPAGAGLFRRILVPVDASDGAARAVEYVLSLRRQAASPDALEIHVLNVQREVSGDVARFIPKESVDDYHRERSEKSLARARATLDAAGVKYAVRTDVGKPWEKIAEHARALGADHIVMGTRGLGSYTGALLGSIAQGVAAASPVPVVLVR